MYRDYMLLSLHGQSKDALAKTQAGAWEYDIVAPYYKCNMTDIMAAIGLVQLKRYPDILRRRKSLIEQYNEEFKDSPVEVLHHFEDNYTSSGHLYLASVLDKSRQECNNIITKLAEAGIASNVHYKPLPMLTAYRRMGFDIKNYPNAYAQFENEITLPLHTCLTDEQVKYVADTFRSLII
jgi:dTDP-4-amino-4,6-dideoxygalactose transaminase